MMKEKAMDTKASLEGLNLKVKMQTAHSDFSFGWRSIADKAKKEAKTLNKRARKALATYEEGSSVRYDQIYDCDFDTGFSLWLKFQKQWVKLQEETAQNAEQAEVVDSEINELVKAWRKWDTVVSALHDHLVSLPDIIANVEIAHSQIDSIKDQLTKIDKLLIEFEDVNERTVFEKEKCRQRLELSELVEKRQLQFQALKEKYEMTEEESNQVAAVLARQESVEKQQIYEDAFMEQMDRYIKYGELDKPIAGSVDHDHVTDDVSFDDADLDALKEFLGPEELNSVLKSQATLVSSTAKAASVENTEKDSSEVESSLQEEKSGSESAPSPSPKEDSEELLTDAANNGPDDAIERISEELQPETNPDNQPEQPMDVQNEPEQPMDVHRHDNG